MKLGSLEKRTLIILSFVTFSSCTQPKSQNPDEKIDPVKLSIGEIKQLSEDWKKDELGCLHKRNPKMILNLISQLKLIGKDTSELIHYLGKPNSRYLTATDERKLVFVYYLMCSKGKTSYYNFHCFVDKGLVEDCHDISF